VGYSYVFNPLAGAFDTVQDLQTVRAPDNAYIAPTGPVVFQDSFTEASSKLLNLHTPNVGTSWSLALSTGGATYTVNNAGALQPTTTLANVGCLYLANNASPSAAVEVGVTVPTVVSATNVVGVVFRYIDSNNFYLVTISSNAGNVVLWRKVAGVWSNLASSINNVNAGNTVKVRAVGSNIVVYVADLPVITRVDTSISAAGLCGVSAGTIGQNATDDVSNAWRLDNFYVQNYASSGGNNTTGINVTGDVAASGQIVGHNINSRLYPAFTFAGDTDTGIYRSAPDNISFVTAGSVRATFNTTSFAVSGPCYVSNGSAAAPTFSFSSDPNTGIYLPSADLLGFTVNGVLRWTINSTGILADSAAGIPGVSVLDIATHGVVSNSGGTIGGFLAYNDTDYTETYFRADPFTNSGGLYSQGKLVFSSGYDYTLPYNSGVEFTIGAINYDSFVGDFSVSMQHCSGGNGGNIYLYAGGSSSIGVGGNVVIAGGESIDSTGGAVTITGGPGSVAGNTTVEGGYGNASSGGTLYLLGGASGVGAGYGGTVYISGGSDGVGGFGAITIQPNPSALVSIFGAGGSVQKTTATAAATITGTGGTNITTNSLFDGYSIAQVVKALRDYGWLA
jgi:hypothetical protein